MEMWEVLLLIASQNCAKTAHFCALREVTTFYHTCHSSSFYPTSLQVNDRHAIRQKKILWYCILCSVIEKWWAATRVKNNTRPRLQRGCGGVAFATPRLPPGRCVKCAQTYAATITSPQKTLVPTRPRLQLPVTIVSGRMPRCGAYPILVLVCNEDAAVWRL